MRDPKGTNSQSEPSSGTEPVRNADGPFDSSFAQRVKTHFGWGLGSTVGGSRWGGSEAPWCHGLERFRTIEDFCRFSAL